MQPNQNTEEPVQSQTGGYAATSSSKKIIQPIHENLEIDDKPTYAGAIQAQPNQAPLVAPEGNTTQPDSLTPNDQPPTQAAPNPSTTAEPSRPRVDTSAIYPTPTDQPAAQGLSRFGQNSHQNIYGTPKSTTPTSVITIIIMVIGGLIVLNSARILLGFLSSILGGHSTSGLVNFAVIIAALELLLGIGIVLRRELARVIFVVLVIIGLLLSLSGLVGAIANAHTSGVGGALLGRIALGLLIPIAEVVFFSWPSVKAQFD